MWSRLSADTAFILPEQKAMRSTKANLPEQKISYCPWENLLHLQTVVQYTIKEGEVGALLLQKHPKSPYSIVFGFECPGVHSVLSQEEFMARFEKLENALKEIPSGFRIIFHMGAFNSDQDRQDVLDGYIGHWQDDPSLLLQLYSQKQTTQKLARLGLREPKSLRIFVVWEAIQPNYHLDLNDRFFMWGAKWGSKFWLKFTGRQNSQAKLSLFNYLDRAWNSCYTLWQQSFTNTWGLMRTRPLTSTEMWEHLWYQVNGYKKEPAPLPQLLKFTPEGITEEVYTQKHAVTLLADKIPEFHRDHVVIGNECLGILSFWEKPAGWNSRRAQLHYLWKAIGTEQVTNTEIFVELATGDAGRVARYVAEYTRQQKGATKELNKKNKGSAIQGHQADQAEQAQFKLNQGDIPTYVGVTFLVRRSSPVELRDACNYLRMCFPRPAFVAREEQIAPILWLQTLIGVDEKLNGGLLIGKRDMYLSSEAMGFLPLIQTLVNDRQGVEFLADDASSPVPIDLSSARAFDHRHMAIFGKTRSGKSVVLSAFLLQAILDRVPSVVIDYPNADGRSTFYELCRFHHNTAVYIDVRKNSLNLFDRPNLSGFSEQISRERSADYLKYVVNVLTAIVTKGQITDDSSVIRDLLTLALNSFYTDPEILERFSQAEAAGFGSEGWQQMPTLTDFADYFARLVNANYFENLTSRTVNSGMLQISRMSDLLDRIYLSFRAILQSPIAECIARPTSIETHRLLTVFAMTGVNEEDVAVLSLVAYAKAIGLTLIHPRTLFVIDESPILFRYEALVNVVAALISNGAKAGIRVILSAQDVATIGDSKYGSQILNNINTHLIGRVQDSAPKSFEKYLGFPRDLVERCCGFMPNPIYIYTNWLIYDISRYVVVRFYSSPILLALVANNSEEVKAREQFITYFNGDFFEAITAFSAVLLASYRSKKTLAELVDERLKGSPQSTAKKIT